MQTENYLTKSNQTVPPNAERPFAYGLCASKLFWVFVLASVLGFPVETFWCWIHTGHFEMRTALVVGMFIPVYGLGAVAMTVCLHPLSNARSLWIFLGSALIGAAVEYGCSLFQELAFGTVSWDYSDMSWNLGGRVNLRYSFFWGILGIVWLKAWYPALSRGIERIPKRIGRPLTGALAVLLVLDMMLSAAAVARKTQRHEGFPPANSFEVFLDRTFSDRYLDWVYPNMEFVQELDVQKGESLPETQ